MICHKNLSLLYFCSLKLTLRRTRKHFHCSKKYFRPIRMFSCPPSIKKPKEVTSFCDKSRHLFLWQTNRTRLIVSAVKAENFSETFNQEVADRYHSLATLSFPSKGGLISEGIFNLVPSSKKEPNYCSWTFYFWLIFLRMGPN